VLASSDGELRRFILERHPVRGFWIRLDGAWRELRSFHRYPPAVEALLGEAVTASLLLAATLKFTLQSNIQRWLGDLIELADLNVTAEEAVLRVGVRYVVRRTRESVTLQLTHQV